MCRFVVKGVTTNMPHLRSCIANPAFRAGTYDTSFIPTYYGGPRELHTSRDLRRSVLIIGS